jgi:AraC-like DNA-binding protein
MVGETHVHAWKPSVSGIHEVLHAHFTDHAYPLHTHDAWTLLIVDAGVIGYGLDRHQHDAAGAGVTLLPPDVPHDGRSLRPEGFRKRVLYLDREVIDPSRIGAAVDRPHLRDSLLRRRIHELHVTLGLATEDLEAESRLALVADRLSRQLRADPVPAEPATSAHHPLAHRLRELIDARLPGGISLAEAARELTAHPSQLVRSFSREFGIPPHRYVTGRRIDLARRRLLEGAPPAEAAVASGFYDQSHLTRHFRRMLGTSPTLYTRDRRRQLAPERPGS